MDFEREQKRVDVLLDKAQRAEDTYQSLVRAGGISRQHVLSLESIKPGILTDLNLPGGFTDETSDRHYTIALEQADILRHILFSAGFAAILYLFVKLVGKSGLFGGGGGSGGGGGGGSYSSGIEEDKRKNKEKEAKLTQLTEQIRAAVEHVPDFSFRGLITEDIYAFLTEIKVDKTIQDSIRNSDAKARDYFFNLDANGVCPFMNDVYMCDINHDLPMILTSPYYSNFQKNASGIASAINDGKENRVERLKTIVERTNGYVEHLAQCVQDRNFTGSQGHEATYVEDERHDPEDIIKLRTIFKYPPTKSAHEVVSMAYNLFVDWNKPARDPQHQHKFKTKEEFEERCSQEFMALCETDGEYVKYMADNADTLIKLLQDSEKKIGDLRRQMIGILKEATKSGQYTTDFSQPENQYLFGLTIIRKELDKLNTFVHSFVITTQNLTGVMRIIASLARKIKIIYVRGDAHRTKAAKILEDITRRMNDALKAEGV